MDVWWFPTISYVKIGNHLIDTTIYKWLFGVPGIYRCFQKIGVPHDQLKGAKGMRRSPDRCAKNSRSTGFFTHWKAEAFLPPSRPQSPPDVRDVPNFQTFSWRSPRPGESSNFAGMDRDAKKTTRPARNFLRISGYPRIFLGFSLLKINISLQICAFCRPCLPTVS